jgi:hypothetical protein
MVLRASKASVCGCVPGDVGRRLSGRDEVEGRRHASLEASLNTSSIAQVCQQGVRRPRRNAATEEISVVGLDAAATFVSAQRKRDRRYVVRVSGDAVGGPLFELGVPFWGITKTKVTPLQDFEDRRDLDKQGAEQMEQSLQQ